MRRFVHAGVGLLTALLLVASSTREVAAHANFERSDPPANSILEKAPDQITAWFTEAPETQFSELQVFDSSRGRVDRGETKPVAGDPRALTIGLPDLAPGTYTVVWKTLSAVDGHVTRGAFALTVGLDQTPGPLIIPSGAEAAAGNATPWTVGSRWLNLLAAVVLAAAFLFLPLILGVALRAVGASGTEPATVAAAWGAGRRRGLLVALVAAGVGLLAGVLALVVQAAVAAGVEPWEVFGAPLTTLLRTRYSLIWLVRMLALAALAVLAWYLRRPGTGVSHPGWLVGAGLGGVLLFTNSLNSHAAAAQEGLVLAIAADWLHLLATAVWVGGLVQLAIALPATLGALPAGPRGRLLATAIPRFSVVALISIAVLVVTGLYATWLEVGTFDALGGTAYGQALLAKIALLLPLLALGALNMLVLSPRTADAVRRHTRAAAERLGTLERRFRGVVVAEVLLGVTILGIVGLLTSLEPARDALRAQGIARNLQADDVHAVLRIAPAEAGVNTFDVALSEGGQPLTDAQRVTLRMSHMQMDMGTTDQRLEPVGDGHYGAQSGALSMAGDWDLKVIVRLAGRDDVQAETQLTATDPGAARNQPGAPTTASTSLPPTRFVVGAVLFALGVLLLVNAIRPGAHRRQRRTTLALGCAAVVVGLPLATLAALVPTAVDVVIPNPVPASTASVARGQEIFQQNCTICHGLGGRGDGPLARTLNPRPADLRVHVSQHSEGQLWLWISDGVPGTAMPAFRGSFSDEDRWNLINYLESQFGTTASTGSGQQPRAGGSQ
jgi:copper transport protein